MKIRLGKLRSVLREASSDQEIDTLDGFNVGEWYVDEAPGYRRGQACQLRSIFRRGELTFADVVWADASSQQRFDIWASHVRPASVEEVEAQQAKNTEDLAHMSRNIDTSREGT